MTISPQVVTEEDHWETKQRKSKEEPILCFSKVDKIGTFQPHDDTLVVTLQIREFDVKRVMVDQGSGAKIMYPDFYKGLRLKPEDPSKYDSPLVRYDGKTIIPRGMIRLHV